MHIPFAAPPLTATAIEPKGFAVETKSLEKRCLVGRQIKELDCLLERGEVRPECKMKSQEPFDIMLQLPD